MAGPDGYIAILTFVTTVLQVRYEVHDVVSAGDTIAIRATAPPEMPRLG